GLLAHQRGDGRLRDHQIAVPLERDLDCCLAKKERVVAEPSLHGHEAHLTRRLLPWLFAVRIERRHRLPGPSGDDRSTLHRLAVDRRRREIEADLCPLLAVLGFDEDAVADDDELFVVADHGVGASRIWGIYPAGGRRCPINCHSEHLSTCLPGANGLGLGTRYFSTGYSLLEFTSPHP